MSRPWESYLTPQELQVYTSLFNAVSRTIPEQVTGAEAVQFFSTSGVPKEFLSDIWETADRDNLGYLTRETFAIALKLIACAQHGRDRSEPILATVVPLPQFEGYPVAPPSPSMSGPVMTPAEREKYTNIFRVHQQGEELMDGEKAKSIFVRSKLPEETLAAIWNLADVRRAGNLNQSEFAVAMHYIAKLMDGTIKSLPTELPEAVYASACGSTPRMAPQRVNTIDSLGSMAFASTPKEPAQWDVSAQEKAQYDAFFDKIDKNRTEFVQGAEAVEFFKNSRLPSSELALIWSLADTQNRGKLNRNEFAVAMHLIHKRLRGEMLPTTMPPTLVPPSPLIHQPIPSPVVQTSVVATHPSGGLDDQDLLGDFGNNDQLPRSTNEVNQLQNQMANLQTNITEVRHQKLDTQQTLEQLIRQKQELQAQLSQVQMAHEAEVKDLNELQEKLQNEQPAWLQAKQEYDAAEQQLAATRAEKAQLELALQNGRNESERLRHEISQIQEETARLATELDKLRAQVKQQNMMLDINRRQVTASEQDRDQAKRDLADFKAERNLPDTLPEEDSVVSVTSPKSPEQKAVETPASNTSGGFDDIFGAFIQKSESVTSAAASPSSSSIKASPLSAFDPVGWATPPERPSPAATNSPQNAVRSAKHAPPPPPPQSRHHRQPSETQGAGSTTKPRAPPPPPPSTQKQPPAASSTSNEKDDFDALFSVEPLGDVQTVESKTNEFANFDEAFASVEPTKVTEKTTETKTLSWASNFGGFDFAEPSKDDEWDSIFGGPAPAQNDKAAQQANAGSFTGFEDAFSSVATAPKESKASPSTSAPNPPLTGTNNSNIDDLVKMGFGLQEAKDALERYDQNLEKATNFLLDQSSK